MKKVGYTSSIFLNCTFLIENCFRCLAVAGSASDCLLYREIKNNQDQIDLQRDLDALMDWGSTWGMKFNAKKCNIMRVSRSRKPLQHFYSLGNEILQEVSDAKYLGIQIVR